MAGNIDREELEEELHKLYVFIGSNNTDIEGEVFDRVWEIEEILNPTPKWEPETDFKCHCHRRDCWECVYKDDPMGI